MITEETPPPELEGASNAARVKDPA